MGLPVRWTGSVDLCLAVSRQFRTTVARAFLEDKAQEDVGKDRQPDPGPVPVGPNGADEQAHQFLLVVEEMRDVNAPRT